MSFYTDNLDVRFAEDLLDCLYGNYYSWIDLADKKARWPVKVKKCREARFSQKIPAKADKTYTGQSLSFAKSLMRDKGWKNLSNFTNDAREAGFTVIQFYNMTLITL